MNTPTLTSERLILRPFDKSDVEAVYNGWDSDPEIAKYITT